VREHVEPHLELTIEARAEIDSHSAALQSRSAEAVEHGADPWRGIPGNAQDCCAEEPPLRGTWGGT
jgi:hypothetical protein